MSNFYHPILSAVSSSNMKIFFRFTGHQPGLPPSIVPKTQKPPPESGRRLFLCHDRQFLIQIPLQTTPLLPRRGTSIGSVRREQSRTPALAQEPNNVCRAFLPFRSTASRVRTFPPRGEDTDATKGRGGNYSLRPAFPVLTG